MSSTTCSVIYCTEVSGPPQLRGAIRIGSLWFDSSSSAVVVVVVVAVAVAVAVASSE